MDSKPREEKGENERNREAKKEKGILSNLKLIWGSEVGAGWGERKGGETVFNVSLGPHSSTSPDQEQLGQWSIS